MQFLALTNSVFQFTVHFVWKTLDVFAAISPDRFDKCPMSGAFLCNEQSISKPMNFYSD